MKHNHYMIIIKLLSLVLLLMIITLPKRMSDDIYNKQIQDRLTKNKEYIEIEIKYLSNANHIQFIKPKQRLDACNSYFKNTLLSLKQKTIVFLKDEECTYYSNDLNGVKVCRNKLKCHEENKVAIEKLKEQKLQPKLQPKLRYLITRQKDGYSISYKLENDKE